MKTYSEILDPRSIAIDTSINPRDAVGSSDTSYDIPGMRIQIEDVGYLTTPPAVEKLPNGTYRVLQGFQRLLAIEDILKDPNAKPTLKEALSAIRCTVHEELKDEERDAIVYDHGATRPLTRVETIRMVWKHYQTMDYTRLVVRFWTQLLKLSAVSEQEKLKAKMAAEKNENEKRKILTTFFRGTVNDYIIAGFLMGPRVQAAMIETEAGRDSAEFKTSRKNIGALATAMNRDLSKTGKDAKNVAYPDWNPDFDGKGWNQKDGGNNFNAVLAKLIAEKNGEATPGDDKEKPLSHKELGDRVLAAKSKAVKVAYKIAKGGKDLESDEKDFFAIDGNAEALESIQSAIVAKLDEVKAKLPEPVQAVLMAIAYTSGSSAGFEKAFAELLNPAPVEEPETTHKSKAKRK